MSTTDDYNEATLGKKLSALMKANAARRVVGLLTARGRSDEWQVAFEHIAEHFNSTPKDDPKKKHSVFRSKYRDIDTMKELLRRAASGPSTVVATRLTIETGSGREALGRPAVKIVRLFGEQIGEEPDQNCVVIIVDHGGTLITAYPATEKAI